MVNMHAEILMSFSHEMLSSTSFMSHSHLPLLLACKRPFHDHSSAFIVCASFKKIYINKKAKKLGYFFSTKEKPEEFLQPAEYRWATGGYRFVQQMPENSRQIRKDRGRRRPWAATQICSPTA